MMLGALFGQRQPSGRHGCHQRGHLMLGSCIAARRGHRRNAVRAVVGR